MLALEIQDVKLFMAKLLKDCLFDDFDARSVEIETFVRFTIDGFLTRQPKEDEANAKQYIPWQELKPYVFDIIKGKRLPGKIHIVLSGQEALEAAFPEASALFVNILFDAERLLITTGIAMKTFSLDKGPEKNWDDYVKNCLLKTGIAC